MTVFRLAIKGEGGHSIIISYFGTVVVRLLSGCF
jgi:hypothetical protein